MIGTAKLAQMAAGLVRRARETVAPAVERIETVRYDPPPVRLTHLIIIGLAWPLSLYTWGKWSERGRDAWWRERIASSSQSVRAEIERGGSLATTTDDEIIRGLSDVDAKLSTAEHALQAYRSTPRPPERDRCRIPADCLRE